MGYNTLLKAIKPNALVLRFKVDELNDCAKNNKLTVKATAGEKLIITDQATGEEYVVEDLGYPF